MSVGVVALLLAGMAQAGAEAPPPIVHEQRPDDVGPVAIAAPSANAPGALTIAHRGLPADSFAEITDLATGRTIIALVQAEPASSAAAIGSLSAGAAGALGLSGNARPAVRIRPAAPSPAEQAAVRSGTVVRRLDAPSALLAALRRRLPQPAAPVAVAAPAPAPAPVTTTPAKPTPRPVPPPAPVKAPSAARGRWFVQVAALSDAARAATLAKSVDGVVRSAGRLYRVQAGPFATRAAAETARASIARRGFGDARIIAQD